MTADMRERRSQRGWIATFIFFFFVTFTHSQTPVFLHKTTSVAPFEPHEINWLFKHNKDSINRVFENRNV